VEQVREMRDLEQVQEVVRLVGRVLGSEAVGVYPHGSGVLGGLRPASDLDVLVVTRRRMNGPERRALLDGLLNVSGPGGPGGPRPVELTVVVHSEVRPWRFPPTADFLYGEWLREEFMASGPPAPESMPDLALLITIALSGGHPLSGHEGPGTPVRGRGARRDRPSRARVSHGGAGRHAVRRDRPPCRHAEEAAGAAVAATAGLGTAQAHAGTADDAGRRYDTLVVAERLGGLRLPPAVAGVPWIVSHELWPLIAPLLPEPAPEQVEGGRGYPTGRPWAASCSCCTRASGGLSSGRSPGCTASAACASAGKDATTFTRPSSASPSV
jgi:predicted nucleotidyltransferase